MEWVRMRMAGRLLDRRAERVVALRASINFEMVSYAEMRGRGCCASCHAAQA